MDEDHTERPRNPHKVKPDPTSGVLQMLGQRAMCAYVLDFLLHFRS